MLVYLQLCKGSIKIEDSIAFLDELALLLASWQHHGLCNTHGNQQLINTSSKVNHLTISSTPGTDVGTVKIWALVSAMLMCTS